MGVDGDRDAAGAKDAAEEPSSCHERWPDEVSAADLMARPLFACAVLRGRGPPDHCFAARDLREAQGRTTPGTRIPELRYLLTPPGPSVCCDRPVRYQDLKSIARDIPNCAACPV